MDHFTLPQIAQGLGIFFGALGIVGYGLKKNGKLHFGTPKERRNCAKTCPEHSGLIKRVENIDKKLDIVIKDLSEAVGFIKAKTGGQL